MENLPPQNTPAEAAEHIEMLAVEYLNKICPIYSRIHMPSLKKMDYEDSRTKIRIKRNDDLNILGKFKAYLWKSDNSDFIELPIKKFIMLMKASAVDLFYDAVGNKRHFSEPSNLRDFVQTYTFYNKLLKIEKGDAVEKEQAIFKEILDDLYFRYAPEHLSKKEYLRLQSFLDVSIERRSRDILLDIRKYIPEGQRLISEITYRGNEDILSYSYGELLYGLYNASSREWYSKKFICCILDSYTIVLTKLYRQILANSQGSTSAKEKFLNLIDASISSSWSNKFVPMLKIIHTEKDKTKEKLDYNINKSESVSVAAASIKYSRVYAKWSFELDKNVGKKLSEHTDKKLAEKKLSDSEIKQIKEQVINDAKKHVTEQLHMIEILCMFFTEIRQEDEEVKAFEITYKSGTMKLKNEVIGDDKNDEPHFDFFFIGGCFNIMNFVKNLFAWESFFDPLHKNLFPELEKYIQDLRRLFGKNDEVTDTDISAFLENNSLKKKFETWNASFHGFAMPFYSFDMMYNIFKRKYQEQGYLPSVVEGEDFWKYVKKTYDAIGCLLSREDTFYFSNANGETKDENSMFFRAYQESPFISYINELENEDNVNLKEEFESHFINMMLSIAQIM